MEQLVRAWHDCRKRKRGTASAQAFEAEVERNLCALRAELLEGSYQPGRSICFVVQHPRPREVWAAGFRDRVVHHLLYNAIAPLLLPGFDVGSAACIPGRGTLYAAQRLEADVRSATENWSRPAWYLKCDLANFFVAIDKPTLQARLHAKVPPGFWRWLTDVVLMHDPRSDYELRGAPQLLQRVPPHKRLLEAPAATGLPIGNLSSQFFANVLLDGLDKHVRHALHARWYGRYVDDFYLLHHSPQWLNEALASIEAYLPTLRCALNPRKTVLQPAERGIDFVGQVVRPWRRTLRRNTVRTALQRLRDAPPEQLFATGNSYLGLAGQASHGHRDRARIARVVLARGHAVRGDLAKAYRGAARA